jgi:hypothetical protein
LDWLDLSGLVWFGLVWFGLVWSGLVLVCTPMAYQLFVNSSDGYVRQWRTLGWQDLDLDLDLMKWPPLAVT